MKVDNFHTAQILITAIVLIMCVSLDVYGPEGRVTLAHDTAVVCSGFLFGKFANGFGKRNSERKE